MGKRLDQGTDLVETVAYAVVILFGIACVLAIPFAIWQVIRG